MGREYEAIMKVISDFDGRLITVKGWSVTLSLAALGLGFERNHYALFFLGACTALGFWYVDSLMKRFQMQYYSRMRDIEVAAFHLNRLDLNGQQVSSPKVDWNWGYTGQGDKFMPDAPVRRSPKNVRNLLARAPLMPGVFLPHAVAVVLGFGLFILAVLRAPGFEQMML
jgi:hypothetical protein